MTPEISVRVHGTPVTQGSKTRLGRRIIADNETRLRPWRDAIRGEVQDAIEAGAAPLEPGVPVHVTITFFFARPKHHHGARGLKPAAPTYPTNRMDVDKLCRAVLDACTDAGAWADDGQVVQLAAHKQYADVGPPGARITIRKV